MEQTSNFDISRLHELENVAYLYGEERKYVLLNGTKVWKTPSERDNYLMTLQSAKRLGKTEITYQGLIIPIDTAITLLDAVNVYAFAVTTAMDAHAENIAKLDNNDAIEAYDYKQGYPDILEYNFSKASW